MSREGDYGAVVLAVAHNDFFEISTINWKNLINKNGILFDLKGIIPRVRSNKNLNI